MQKKTTNKPKEATPIYMRIRYKDHQDVVVDAVIRIPDYDYYEQASYKDNVDRAINNIMDEGGFWLNDSTAIPRHRVVSFHTHQEKKEKKVTNEKKTTTETKATPEKKKTNTPEKKPPNRNRGRRRRPTPKKTNENTVSTNNTVPHDSGNTGAGA